MATRGFGLAVVSSLVLAGCGDSTLIVGDDGAGTALGELADDNGLDSNALRGNALRGNSLSSNALRGNALRGNALRGNGLNGMDAGVTAITAGNALFSAWFSTSAYNPTLMKYFVRCVLPAGENLTYSGSYLTSTGALASGSFTWPGSFGTAPNWFTSVEQTVAEEEATTACLMAHVNAKAQPVTLSFRSDLITSAPTTEMKATPNREGAFFGNLWAATPVLYSCAAPSFNVLTGCTYTMSGLTSVLDPTSCSSKVASAGNPDAGRSCATGTACGFTNLGQCDTVCAAQLQDGGTNAGDGHYKNCAVNGHVYAGAMSTFLQAFCGDGVCSSWQPMVSGASWTEMDAYSWSHNSGMTMQAGVLCLADCPTPYCGDGVCTRIAGCPVAFSPFTPDPRCEYHTNCPRDCP